MPEGETPGLPLRFATALPLAGYGRGVIVTSVEGRPIKIDGNPRHPASLGSTDVFAEATVLSLYDPDRSKAPYSDGRIQPWSAFEAALQPRLEQARAQQGAGLALLTGRVTSPTLVAQIAALTKALPQTKWYRYEPVEDDAIRGRRDAGVRPPGNGVAALWRCAGGARARRRSARCRTGANSFCPRHRRRAASACAGAIAAPLRRRAGLDLDRRAGRPSPGAAAGTDAAMSRWRSPARLALRCHSWSDRPRPSNSPRPPPPISWRSAARLWCWPARASRREVHALCHWINNELARAGRFHRAGRSARMPAHADSLRGLVADVPWRTYRNADRDRRQSGLRRAGRTGARRYRCRDAVLRASRSYRDETAARCTWHLPLTHVLESWSDIRAFDGTASIIQPLIRPLYDTRTAHRNAGAIDRRERAFLLRHGAPPMARHPPHPAISTTGGGSHCRTASSPIPPRRRFRRRRRNCRKSPPPAKTTASP